MREEADDVGVEGDGPVAGPDVLKRRAGNGRRREKVGPVIPRPLQAGVPAQERPDGTAGRLLLDRDRDRVLVVLDVEDDR